MQDLVLNAQKHSLPSPHFAGTPFTPSPWTETAHFIGKKGEGHPVHLPFTPFTRMVCMALISVGRNAWVKEVKGRLRGYPSPFFPMKWAISAPGEGVKGYQETLVNIRWFYENVLEDNAGST